MQAVRLNTEKSIRVVAAVAFIVYTRTCHLMLLLV